MRPEKQGYGVVVVAVFSLTLALPLPMSATIIDSFSTSQGPVVDASGTASGPGIVGGWRDVSATFFVATAGVGTFSTPDGSGNVMSAFYDGINSTGAFVSPVDLTDGGVADQFLLGISAIDSPFFGSVAVGVVDVNSNVAFVTFQVLAPGLYTASLPSQQADLTQINSVGFAVFLGTSPPTGGLMSIDFLCTGASGACTTTEPVSAVPEPGTAVLLLLGGTSLALLRRGLQSRPGCKWSVARFDSPARGSLRCLRYARK
jgi:hypothetical protein